MVDSQDVVIDDALDEVEQSPSDQNPAPTVIVKSTTAVVHG